MQDATDNRTTPLPLRDHTILGVCEAIGEDFGFNPIWLRVPLAACVLISVKYAIAAYLLLGVVVLASRLLFPTPKVADELNADRAQDTANCAESEEHEFPLAA